MFDSKSSAKLELAHLNGESSVKVSLRAEVFDINLRAKTGKGNLKGETIAIYRKVKRSEEGKKF